MASSWETLRLLLWKNYLLQIRKPWITTFEILLPLICCALLVVVRCLVEPKIYEQVTRFSPIRPDEISLNCDNLDNSSLSMLCKDEQTSTITPISSTQKTINNEFSSKNLKSFVVLPEILYSPENTYLDEIISYIGDQIFLYSEITSVNDSIKLEEKLTSNNYIVGIEFADELKNISSLPTVLKYNLRFPGEIRSSRSINILYDNWKTTKLFSNFPLKSARTFNDDDGSPGYYAEGFLKFQSLIFEAFVALINDSKVDEIPLILIQKFPYPPGYYDSFHYVLNFIVPLYVVMVFMFPCINIVKYVLVENEKKLTSLMKILGVKPHIDWISWFIKSYIYTLIIAIIFVIFLKVKWFESKMPIIEQTSISVLTVFVSIYSFTLVMYALMITTFCKNSGTATSIVSFSFMCQIIPFITNCDDKIYIELSRHKKLTLSVLPNSAMGLAMRCIALRESHDGIQWNNLFENFSDDINFGEIMLIIFLEGIIFLIIIVIVEIFKKIKDAKKTSIMIDQLASVKCVKIENLTKVFKKSSEPAVDKLNLLLNEDEITVLLGVNGAGKSTTMSMLCGEMASTSGSMYVNETNVTVNGRSYYNSTGICFQENVLFSNLTVKEHLIFFGRLKGSSSSEAEKEAKKLSEILELQPNDLTCYLSGGMKRKLCMAIALCSNSKFVIFDEITSGVDPVSRRQIWNYLKEAKKNRIILMSTNIMLEAEALADKIAILCDGKLKAFGTPFELKQRISKAYNLTCVKKNSCDSRSVVEFLRKLMPNLTILNETEIEIHLRFEKHYDLQTYKVLEMLEENLDKLNLENFAVSSNLIDGIVERLENNSSNLFSTILAKNKDNLIESNKITRSYNVTKNYAGIFSHFFIKLMALSNKKFITIYRNFNILLLQIILPVILVLFLFAFGHQFTVNDKQGGLKLSIKTYSPTRVFMKLESDVKNNSIQFKIYESYKKMLETYEDVEIFETSSDMQETFLENSKKYNDLNFKNLYGITVSAENVTGWFNNQPYHTLPIALNMVHNACLKALFGEFFEIIIGNKPLPYRAESKALFEPISQMTVNYQISLIMSFGLTVSFAAFVISVIKERLGNAKFMQLLIGINPVTYWLTIFLWDFFIVLVISAAVSIAYEALQNPEFSSYQEFWMVFGLVAVLGFTVLPITYVCSFIFGSPTSGFVFLIMIFIITGPGLFIVTLSYEPWLLDLPELKELFKPYFIQFPFYNFCDAIIKINSMNDIRKSCKIWCDHFDICDPTEQCDKNEICCNTNLLSWSERGIGWNINHFIIIFYIAIFILYLVESKLILTLIKYILNFRSKPKGTEMDTQAMDTDVQAETTKIENMIENDFKNFNLLLNKLTKVYPTKQSVRNLSIAIKPGECFGLLGFNGAGKTTTFRMLIGELPATSGDIFINGLNIKTNLKKIHKLIGYCGQFDALIDELTGRETLTFYAQCHGIRNAKINNLIMQLSTDFDFFKQLDKQVRHLSGGNKRKLSTLIALIGDPQILLLDEPTAFMDPIVKTKFLKQIGKLRDYGKTVILSSHNIEEIETLCDRIGIMMKGDLVCLGSPQFLKNKFDKTVTITLKLKTIESIEGNKIEVKEFIEQELAGVQLKEEFNDMLVYHVTLNTHKWSKILKVIETAKDILNIVDDFSITGNNLLQVFEQIPNNSD